MDSQSVTEMTVQSLNEPQECTQIPQQQMQLKNLKRMECAQ